MRAFTLFLLRLSTGLLLIIWGSLRIIEPEVGEYLSGTYYKGIFNGATIHMFIGGAEVVLGLMVILGLLRKYVYPLQAIILGMGLLAITPYILDPYGIWLLSEEEAEILFFPSTTIFFSTLIMLVFKEFDTFSADVKLMK